MKTLIFLVTTMLISSSAAFADPLCFLGYTSSSGWKYSLLTKTDRADGTDYASAESIGKEDDLKLSASAVVKKYEEGSEYRQYGRYFFSNILKNQGTAIEGLGLVNKVKFMQSATMHIEQPANRKRSYPVTRTVKLLCLEEEEAVWILKEIAQQR
jgi:hypothetical protein